jgi:hypothetical protein
MKTTDILVKIIFKLIIKRGSYRFIQGRYLDRYDRKRGRFTRHQVNSLLEQSWCNYEELLPGAHVTSLKSQGARLLVSLSVITLALFRALRADGIEKEHATELATDIVWAQMEKLAIFRRFIGWMKSRDPQKQMDTLVRMALRFPFSRPDYDWRVLSEKGVIAVDFYRCPVYDYYKSQAEEELLLNTWCEVDFAYAQILTRGGLYERPHTLAAGDMVCDMKWYGKSNEATNLRRKV